MCPVKEQRLVTLTPARRGKGKRREDNHHNRIPSAVIYPGAIEALPAAPGVLMVAMADAAPMKEAIGPGEGAATWLAGKKNNGWHNLYSIRKNRCRG